ncbi:MAG: sigma-54-dependent Fis family transcriptional regulator [Candidatus Tectomicrobia bacterium]|uniref:Sigma-54-dependent Fis family transcriptional regulator n=1 Tax=Tectimicrobiota bacterium TaxID=2528274 RepID=A0A932ML14_UNCTE|nr:sigma-54-dependent Fis family transcriptional regulator [Candidatus Tectomicrobia bacterium]
MAGLSGLLFVGALSPGRRHMLDGLEELGVRVEAAAEPGRAWECVERCGVVLLAPGSPADIPLIPRFEEQGKPVGMVLRAGDKGLAPHGLKAGARSVFVDEVHPEEVLGFVRSVTEEGLLRREVRWLRAEVRQQAGAGILIGGSAPSERLRRSIREAGPRHRAILLRGEKGASFAAVGRALHARHPGQRHPLIQFQARQPAFEKALARLEKGKGSEGEILELGGTLLVEEAQLLPRELQVRLAAAALGGPACPEFRLIVCETIDPERLIQDSLIPSLCDEARCLPVRIPTLRERRKDLPELAEAVLRDFAERFGLEPHVLTPGAVEAIQERPWWGNESELEMSLCRAVLLSGGPAISVDAFAPDPSARRRGEMEEFFRERLAPIVGVLGKGGGSDFYEHTIRSVEKPLLELVLRESGGNQLKAAQLLGMNRNTLHRKLQELNLTPPAGRRGPRRK